MLMLREDAPRFMNVVANRFSRCVTSKVWWLLVGAAIITGASGCNRPSAELQELDAKAMSAPPPPTPLSPEEWRATLKSGTPLPGLMPPGMPSAPPVAPPPTEASAPETAAAPPPPPPATP